MSNKEAIERLIELISEQQIEYNLPDECEELEPLYMAISALKQQPCEDAISREVVLKKIDYEVEHFCKYLEEVDDKRNAQTHVALVSDNIREEVEQLPSVTRQTGEWIDGKCSRCGYGVNPWNIGINYCPNCGAKMIEPQKSEGEE